MRHCAFVCFLGYLCESIALAIAAEKSRVRAQNGLQPLAQAVRERKQQQQQQQEQVLEQGRRRRKRGAGLGGSGGADSGRGGGGGSSSFFVAPASVWEARAARALAIARELKAARHTLHTGFEFGNVRRQPVLFVPVCVL
jgi:hypothetical protein